MNIEEIKKEINLVNIELKKYEDTIKIIDELKKKKTDLKKKATKLETITLPFEKQFEKWVGNSKGNSDSYIPDRSEFPNLRELMDETGDFHRYSTVNVKEDYPFRDYWSAIMEPDGKVIAEEEE